MTECLSHVAVVIVGNGKAEMESKQSEKLRTDKSRHEVLARWGARIVVLGLVIEVALAYLSEEHKIWWRKWGPVAADALVALGVIAEIYFGKKASEAGDKLQIQADERVANAELEAARSRERTAIVESRTAWRRISSTFRRTLASVIRNTQSELIVRIECDADGEAHMYAYEIAKAFYSGGAVNTAVYRNSYLHHIPYGVWVDAAHDADVAAIMKTFVDCEIQVSRVSKDLSLPTLRMDGKVPNVYIYVGLKEWPKLDEETDIADESHPSIGARLTNNP